MKSYRERFNENYVAVSRPAKNKNGFKIEYVYYAPWYIWDVLPDKLKLRKGEILMLAIIDTVCFLAAAFQVSAVNSNIVVEFAGILSICALIFELIGAVQFYTAKRRTTRDTFRQVNYRLTLAPLIRAVLLAVCTGGCVYSMAVDGISAGSIIAAIFYLLCTAVSLAIRLIFERIPWTTEKNDTLEHESLAEEKKGEA